MRDPEKQRRDSTTCSIFSARSISATSTATSVVPMSSTGGVRALLAGNSRTCALRSIITGLKATAMQWSRLYCPRPGHRATVG
jgi:hypothetical protein